MPHFLLYDILKWLHLVFLAMGGGAMMVILILIGFEADRKDLKGMTSVLWKRTASWAFRITVLLGLALLAMKFRMGQHPFDAHYLHLKLVLAILLLAMSEMSPKALGAARRGAPLLAFVLFLLVTFVSVNKEAFGSRRHRVEPSIPVAGALEQGPN
jgi:uncharacterized membrane protein